MSTALVIAGLWVVVLTPLVISWVSGRRPSHMEAFQRGLAALGSAEVAASHRAAAVRLRRAQVTASAYILAGAFVSAGLAQQSATATSIGVAMANLGTMYRLALLRTNARARANRLVSHGPR